MILRRYGTTVQSVGTHFDARALNEIGFRRDHKVTMPEEEFFDAHEKVESAELTATAEGPVQDESETELLESLKSQLQDILDDLAEGEVVFVESDADDYPKTRDEKKEVIVDGENRLYFHWRVEPPLRVAVYRKAG